MYYTTQDVVDLTSFATSHGVRIVPELDIPAHVNEGWQWGPEAGKGDLLTCYTGYDTDKVWTSYGLEPPTCQLNIANPNVEAVLGDLYKALVKGFGRPDMFSTGGDEV